MLYSQNKKTINLSENADREYMNENHLDLYAIETWKYTNFPEKEKKNRQLINTTSETT